VGNLRLSQRGNNPSKAPEGIAKILRLKKPCTRIGRRKKNERSMPKGEEEFAAAYKKRKKGFPLGSQSRGLEQRGKLVRQESRKEITLPPIRSKTETTNFSMPYPKKEPRQKNKLPTRYDGEMGRISQSRQKMHKNQAISQIAGGTKGKLARSKLTGSTYRGTK